MNISAHFIRLSFFKAVTVQANLPSEGFDGFELIFGRFELIPIRMAELRAAVSHIQIYISPRSCSGVLG